MFLKRILLFRNLSIQQRLPLIMCIILLCAVAIFSFASYYGLRNASQKIGKERLQTITSQIAGMLEQSARSSFIQPRTLLRRDTIRNYLRERDIAFHEDLVQMMNRIKKDSTWVKVELLDKNGISLLSTSSYPVSANQKFFSDAFNVPTSDSIVIGSMIAREDSIFCPIVARISDNGAIIGYLVSWNFLRSTQASIDQVSGLMGEGYTLYLGNKDGDFWSDMIVPVDHRKILPETFDVINKYNNNEGNPVYASTKPIPNTNWVMLVEVDQSAIVETATSFLNWMIIIGLFIIVGGTFVAWRMGINIIKPLNKLSKAATAVSGQNYSPVIIESNDEIGKLAAAFNSMAEKIALNHQNLEKLVVERTQQLEKVNQELEAFSYSVSHDLRAPLRGVIGFTTILEEDYSSQLDDEAKRIAGIIKANALTMGNLIDDLLSFSRLGRQAIQKTPVNTMEMVTDVIERSGKNTCIEWVIKDLPEVYADHNTLRQVWVNLISNAVKYSAKVSHPKIEIGSVIKDSEQIFYVKDNGAGFDQKYSGKLFKVFQRLHNANEFDGTGVGLAIVEKIISKHGGKVWATGVVNEGATFNFSLPIE